MNGPLRSVYIGENQSPLATAIDAVVIGDGAGGFGLRGATQTVLIGSGAGAAQVDNLGNTFIGYNAASTSVTASNVCIGSNATCGTAGSGGGNSVVVGAGANAGAGSDVAIGLQANASGSNAIAIGQSATAAASCVSIGHQASHGINSSGLGTFVGFQAGYTATTANATTTGTGQTCLGWNTGANTATQLNYITCVGHGVTAGASGVTAIGVDSAGTPATSSVADEIVLGTALSGTKLGNISGLTATTGHVYIPLVAGTPTGVPVAKAGYAAHLFDSTAGKLWAYYGAAWHFVTLT